MGSPWRVRPAKTDCGRSLMHRPWLQTDPIPLFRRCWVRDEEIKFFLARVVAGHDHAILAEHEPAVFQVFGISALWALFFERVACAAAGVFLGLLERGEAADTTLFAVVIHIENNDFEVWIGFRGVAHNSPWKAWLRIAGRKAVNPAVFTAFFIAFRRRVSWKPFAVS